MKILFVHQNFPGQFKHICRVLAAQGRHQVVFLTKPNDNHIPGIQKIVYTPARPVTPNIHHYIGEYENGILHGQAVIRETKEETGLDVEPTGLVRTYYDPGRVIAYADGKVRQEFSGCGGWRAGQGGRPRVQRGSRRRACRSRESGPCIGRRDSGFSIFWMRAVLPVSCELELKYPHDSIHLAGLRGYRGNRDCQDGRRLDRYHRGVDHWLRPPTSPSIDPVEDRSRSYEVAPRGF